MTYIIRRPNETEIQDALQIFRPKAMKIGLSQKHKSPSDVAKCKIKFWSHCKATSKFFPELFKFCLNDIHIQSYNQMLLSSSILLNTSFLTISSHFSKCHFATSDGFSQFASHLTKQVQLFLEKGGKCNMLTFHFIFGPFLPVRENYRIRYGTKSGTGVLDPVHPLPQCIRQTQIISNF